MLISLLLILFNISLWAEAPVIALITEPSLKKLQSTHPEQRVIAFTDFKKFPQFKNIYVLPNAKDSLKVFYTKTFNTSSLKATNILPTEKSSLSPVGQSIPDSYFNYQWYLETQNHTLEAQKYGLGKYIESTAINKQASIEWSDVKNKFENAFHRKARVAVLDSGIDIRHPDIAKHIYKNKEECGYVKALDLYLPEITFTEDKDNNGYIGDCAGWNFTSLKRTRKNEKQTGDNQVYDDSGHGTHVSGIIAAIENKIGIVGISQNIEILPVKVLKQVTSERESRLLSYEGLTHWVAQGILYAIEKDVDVINMSFGWPEKVQSELVNKAIEAAHKAGIIMIAGSGNDSHSASVFPCAHRYVICVGASNIHGELSDFSNYGPQVDLLAPGESILSLIPQKVDTLDVNNIYFFNDDSLAYMWGSSQSAPIISAVSAMLKTQDKSFHEIKNLLISSSKKSELTQSGLFSLKKLMCFIENKNCKTKDIYIYANATIINNNLKIQIENLSAHNKSFTLRVSENNSALANTKVQLNPYENKVIDIALNQAPPYYQWPLNLEFNGYHLKIKATAQTTDFDKTIDFEHVPEFIIDDWKKQYDNRNDSFLYTVKSIKNNQSTPYLYTQKINYEEQTVSINFFKLLNNKVNYLGSYTLNGSTNLFPVSLNNLNQDHEPDFFIRALAQDEVLNRPYEKIVYLSTDLEPINQFNLYAEQAVATTASEFLFYKDNHQKLPMIFKNGLVSKSSIDTKNYENLVSDSITVKQRIYQFKTDSENPTRLVETSFTNTEWFNKMADDLYKDVFHNSHRPEYYQAELLLLIQNKPNELEFISRLYNQKTEPLKQQYFFKTIVNLNTYKARHQIFNLQAYNILGNKYVPMIDLSDNSSNNYTLMSINNKKRDKLRLLHFIDDEFFEQNFEAKNLNDRFIAFHTSYISSNSIFVFLETVNDLVIEEYSLSNLSKPTQRYRQKKIKSSFLPPFTFSEFYLPIFIIDKAKKIPALYNDQSQLFSGRIQVLVPEGRTLNPSLKKSYEVKSGCYNMPLQMINNQFHAVEFCPKDATIKLKAL